MSGTTVAYAMRAYGKKLSREDWENGMDFFFLPASPYFSIRDIDTLKEWGIKKIYFLKAEADHLPMFSIDL